MNSEQYLHSIASEIQDRIAMNSLGSLAPKERIFALVWALEAEVNNGGFNQFFFNSSGEHAIETVEALRFIRAEHTASLLERAITVFGEAGPSKIWESRQSQVSDLREQACEALEELDREFYGYIDNLSELLASFMQER